MGKFKSELFILSKFINKKREFIQMINNKKKALSSSEDL